MADQETLFSPRNTVYSWLCSIQGCEDSHDNKTDRNREWCYSCILGVNPCLILSNCIFYCSLYYQKPRRAVCILTTWLPPICCNCLTPFFQRKYLPVTTVSIIQDANENDPRECSSPKLKNKRWLSLRMLQDLKTSGLALANAMMNC